MDTQGKERQAETRGRVTGYRNRKNVMSNGTFEIWRDQQSIAKRDQIVSVTRNNSSRLFAVRHEMC